MEQFRPVPSAQRRILRYTPNVPGVLKSPSQLLRSSVHVDVSETERAEPHRLWENFCLITLTDVLYLLLTLTKINNSLHT